MDAFDARFACPWPGVVIAVDDPDGDHRIKARINGLMAETDWAYPLTIGGGSEQRGMHVVPAIGADVVVQFMGANPEFPVYSAGWWRRRKGAREAPDDVRDAGADGHLVQSLQVGRFVLTIDERPRTEAGGQLAKLEDKVSGDGLLIDFAKQGMIVKATYRLDLIADGVVNIQGAQVQINGRPVIALPKPI